MGRGATIIVNAAGLLVELKELKDSDCQGLVGSHQVYQTQTFDKECQHYDALQERIEYDRRIAEAEERQRERKKELVRLKREKELQEQNAKASNIKGKRK